jgi:hypothetical protein
VIPDVAEEVAALGIGLEKLLVLFRREGDITVEFAAMEVEVEDTPWCDVGGCRQKLRFERLPVQVLSLISGCAHDSKIVGTVFF